MFFFFKQKTAYELRISDWSSDVCSSDLIVRPHVVVLVCADQQLHDARHRRAIDLHFQIKLGGRTRHAGTTEQRKRHRCASGLRRLGALGGNDEVWQQQGAKERRQRESAHEWTRRGYVPAAYAARPVEANRGSSVVADQRETNRRGRKRKRQR